MQWFGDSYSDIIVFDKATIYTWLGVYSSIFRVIQLLIAFEAFLYTGMTCVLVKIKENPLCGTLCNYLIVE